MSTTIIRMEQRNDTAANWTAANPVMLAGEFGYETDTNKMKLGDGTTAWNGLDYISVTVADLAPFLNAKLNVPTDPGSEGDALLLQGGENVWGDPPGGVSLSSTGTLQTTVQSAGSGERTPLPGGGFMNCVAFADPSITAQASLTGVGILGGDVYGTYVTFDGGDTWQAANEGLTDVKHMKTIAVAFDRVTPNRVWKFTCNYNGTPGVTGSGNRAAAVPTIFYGDLDPITRTLSWTKAYDDSTQSALKLAQGDGATHPRQTGRMIVTDPVTAGRIWVATEDGIVQCTTTTATQKSNYLQGAVALNVVHAIARDAVKDPATGIDIYAAVFAGTDRGVWKIANAQSGAPTKTQITGANAPTAPIGIVTVAEGANNVLYVADAGTAGNPGGVRRYNHGGSAAWDDITPTGGTFVASSGIPAGNNTGVVVIRAIDAVRVGSQTRLLIGHDGPDQLNMAKQAWTLDASAASPTWVRLADTDVDTTYIIKGTTTPWWLPNAPNGPGYNYYALLYSSAGWDNPQCVIRKDDPTKWYAVGRSGIWRYDTSVASPKWGPAVNGIGATISYGVACHPTNPLLLLAADGDWTGFSWATPLGAPRLLQRTSGSGGVPTSTDGKDVAFDDVGVGYLCQANRTTFDNGKVWATSAALNGTTDTWAELTDSGGQTLAARAMAAATDFGVRGLITTRHSDGDLIVIALCGRQVSGSAVAGTAAHAGIFRAKIGSAAPENWTRKDGAINAFQSIANTYHRYHGAAGRTATDANCIYVIDPTKGLMRSTNYGDTWTTVFPKTAPVSSRYSFNVACDPVTPNRVYLTMGNQTWRIDNAHNGTLLATGAPSTGTMTGTNITNGANGIKADYPGPVVVDSTGIVYVANGVSGSTGKAALLRSTDAGVNWTDVSSAQWQGQALLPFDMAIDAADTTVYANIDGLGVISHSFTAGSSVQEFYTKAQVDAIQTSLAASIAAITTVTPDVVLTPGTDFVVNNQQTLQDVTNGGAPGAGSVVTAALAVGTYFVTGYVSYDSSATSSTVAKAKIALTAVTATVSSSEIGWRATSASNGSASASINGAVVAVGTAQSMGAAGVGTAMTAMMRGVLVVSVAGTVKLQWAQSSQEATNTTLHGKTTLVFKKVA